MLKEKTLAPELIDKFKALDTACISDSMDRLGIPCAMLGIHPVVRGTKLCGQAFTVHYTACGQIHGTVGDFLDDVLPGEVIVIDNGGRLDCTVWGDIMSYCSSLRGIAGTVIDGVCRDIPVIDELRYPIFTKSTFMRTGKDRVYVDSVNTPVSVSGIQVVPGDLIVADDSGAVVVPFDMVEKVLPIALEIEEKEQYIRDALRKGVSLKEARKVAGYHSLQTKQS